MRSNPGRIAKVIAAAQDADPMQARLIAPFSTMAKPLWWTPLTYVFLHANWAHVGFNALWLVAFGAPVARRFGPQRFNRLLHRRRGRGRLGASPHASE